MNLYLLLSIIVSTVTSLGAVNWIYFKILKIAKDKGLVDNPDARKLQKSPVPVVGGLAVFFGLILGMLVGGAFFVFFKADIIGDVIFSSVRVLPIFLGMIIMLYVGCIDDILGLSHLSRFVIEILVILAFIIFSGVSIDSLHGMWGIDEFPMWGAILLTVFAGVGIINAINMVDGVNGLSSGLCITYSILFGIVFFSSGDYINALLAFSMVAALLPFFVHNVFGNTSRMFIGDAGTMVMGILMTWFVMCVMHSGKHIDMADKGMSPAAMVLAFLSVPVADTLRVMVLRILKGKSPFSPDKTHLHHAFVGIGISHSITALSEILINVAVVVAWYISACLKAPLHCQLYTVIVTAAVLIWGTYFVLEHEQRSNSLKAQWLRRFSPKTHFGKTEWWQRLSFYLDAPEFDEHERRNLRERLERKFINR